MKSVIYDFSELSDSRELLETKPYPMGVYFIYIVIALMVVSIIWASLSELDIVVKANGVVRPIEKVSTITNTINGKIEKVDFQNGQFVEKDALILKVSLDGFEVETESVDKQVEQVSNEIAMLEKYKLSIDQNKNLFLQSVSDLETNYFYKFQKYEMDLSKVEENLAFYTTKISDRKLEQVSLNEFLRSINNRKDEFSALSKGTQSYQEYQSYLIKYSDLAMSLDRYTKDYGNIKSLFDSGSVSGAELNTAKLNLNQSKNLLEKFTSDTKGTLKANIETIEKSIRDYESELRRLVPETQISANADAGATSTFETETLIAINNQIQDSKVSLDRLLESKKTLDNNIAKTELRSPISGYINFKEEYNVGDTITAGLEVAEIIPEDGEAFKIQIYVLNKDISNVDVGDRVKYRFQALPYKEYGVLEGTVTSISADATYNQAQGASYYLVESTVLNQPMESYKGTKASIKVGMALEAQVISESKKVLYYLLDKIDLWN